MFESFGVKNVRVEDVYSLEESDFVERNAVVYALIFLFKWDASIVSSGTPIHSEDIYFARQIVKDACATQAIVSVLMNTDSMDLGSQLLEFKQNTHDLPSELKGIAIGQNNLFREVHNSFAPPNFFHLKSKPKASEEAESFHFISYVPYKGNSVLELDGLQEHAFVHHATDDGSWLGHALECIKNRINAYNGYLKFDLLAVVKDKRQELVDEISRLSALSSLSPEDELYLNELQHQLQQAQEQRQLGRLENEKRRTNYIPFILEVLRVAEENNKLNRYA